MDGEVMRQYIKTTDCGAIYTTNEL